MYQEEFLPVVFNVRFSSQQALPIEKWQSRIRDVLHLYIDQICTNEDRIIGHIKALAQIDENDFIKYSCISNANAINSKFYGEHQDVLKIDMIINSLVSNITECESRIFLERSCRSLEKGDAAVNIKIDAPEHLMDRHHHKDGEDCPSCNGHHHH